MKILSCLRIYTLRIKTVLLLLLQNKMTKVEIINTLDLNSGLEANIVLLFCKNNETEAGQVLRATKNQISSNTRPS